jgi:hypothetical protein
MTDNYTDSEEQSNERGEASESALCCDILGGIKELQKADSIYLVANAALEKLLELANGEIPNSAPFLLSVLSKAVEGFEQFANDHTKTMQDLAKNRDCIPLLCGPGPIAQGRVEAAMRKLDVAGALPIKSLKANGRGQKKTLGGPSRLGLELIQEIITVRDRRELDDVLINSTSLGYIPPNWRDEALGLPDLYKKTWRRWADVAWKILCETSPNGDPAQWPKMTDYFTPRQHRKNPYFGNIETAGSIATADIKNRLFRAIKALVADNRAKSAKRGKRHQ